MGEGTEATGTAAHAQGMFTDATGTTAHAQGYNTKAFANYAHSEGYGSQATNTAAHAEGWNTIASGLFSHASNRNTVADATCAHAVGEGTQATADAAASEGYYTVASGFAGHAEGYQTEASAYASSAGGYYTLADQAYQTAVGKYNAASQAGVLFSVGNGTATDMRSDALQVHEDGHAVLAGDLEFGGVGLQDTLSSLHDRITALKRPSKPLCSSRPLRKRLSPWLHFSAIGCVAFLNFAPILRGIPRGNGNTTDFGSVILGSSPSGETTKCKAKVNATARRPAPQVTGLFQLMPTLSGDGERRPQPDRRGRATCTRRGMA